MHRADLSLDGAKRRAAVTQFTLRRVMAAVAIVALNAAAARSLNALDPKLPIGIAIMAIVCQCIMLRSAHKLRRLNQPLRPFWIGFVCFGLLGVLSFIWGSSLPPVLMAVATPGRQPRYLNISPLNAFWMQYSDLALDPCAAWLSRLGGLADERGVLAYILAAIIWAAPQFAAAAAGGAIASAVAAMIRGRFSAHLHSISHITA
jgi:hypothetical protein